MSTFFLRTVALLLIPCLQAEPCAVMAAHLKPQTANFKDHRLFEVKDLRFEVSSQALEEELTSVITPLLKSKIAKIRQSQWGIFLIKVTDRLSIRRPPIPSRGWRQFLSKVSAVSAF